MNGCTSLTIVSFSRKLFRSRKKLLINIVLEIEEEERTSQHSKDMETSSLEMLWTCSIGEYVNVEQNFEMLDDDGNMNE